MHYINPLPFTLYLYLGHCHAYSQRLNFNATRETHLSRKCLVYICIASNYDVYLLIWCGVTKYYLVLLKCLLLRNCFVFSTCSQTRGHQYKLFKKHNASRLRAAFFSERIINTWNSLPESVVNFSWLPRFRRSIQKVDFSSFLRCF